MDKREVAWTLNQAGVHEVTFSNGWTAQVYMDRDFSNRPHLVLMDENDFVMRRTEIIPFSCISTPCLWNGTDILSRHLKKMKKVSAKDKKAVDEYWEYLATVPDYRKPDGKHSTPLPSLMGEGVINEE